MNTTPRKYYDIDADATISANSAKKMTPIAQALKWVGEKYPNFNKADIEEYLTSLLEAEQGYASQQAPASTPPVSANDAALMDVDKPDGVYAVNLSWGINYHPTDLSKVMKAKDCLFIGTGKECADFIYKNKPAPVSARELTERDKERAAIYLEKCHISGDTVVKMDHSLDDVPEYKRGSFYLHDLLAAYAAITNALPVSARGDGLINACIQMITAFNDAPVSWLQTQDVIDAEIAIRTELHKLGTTLPPPPSK